MTTEIRPATRRLVLAHGFTQTARSWSDLAARLAIDGLESHALDLPGHGDASHIHTDLDGAADHLAEHGGPAVYVGYSMGGRIALHTTLDHAQVVLGLVLIGATAGIEDDDERAARLASDERRAHRIAKIGVEAFVDEWLRLPLFDGLDAATDQRSERLRNTAEGLASSLRLCGTGAQRPLWNRLNEISVPTLVLVGERDAKFRLIGERLQSGISDSSLVVIADAGHSVHLEQPAATTAAISEWHRAAFGSSEPSVRRPIG